MERQLRELQEHGIAPAVCERLRGLMAEATPEELMRLSPYERADEWNLPRGEVLSAFLYGTRVGLFDLEWDVRCPVCRIDIDGGFDEMFDVVQLTPTPAASD